MWRGWNRNYGNNSLLVTPNLGWANTSAIWHGALNLRNQSQRRNFWANLFWTDWMLATNLLTYFLIYLFGKIPELYFFHEEPINDNRSLKLQISLIKGSRRNILYNLIFCLLLTHQYTLFLLTWQISSKPLSW